MRSIGIDIGRFSLKVVEITASNRTYEVSRFKEFNLINPKSSDNEIEILQALKEISQDFDTESARVVASVRQQYVSTRRLMFPFRERVKIYKSLAFELEDEMPLSIDKAVYDAKVISYKGNAAEVIAMACVSEEIESTLDLFNRGHVDPDIITPELAAVANLYENWQSTVDGFEPLDGLNSDQLLIHLGHSKSFIGVLSGGRLIWGRSVLWGVEKVAEAIAQAFQVPKATAIEMLPDKAFFLKDTQEATKEQLKMSETVTQAFAPLIQACHLTQILVSTEFENQLQGVQVIGPASQIKNLDFFLQNQLELPCTQLNPNQHLKQFKLLGRQELGDSFQMAVGLAIEGLKRPYNPPINFRQLDFAKKNQSWEKLWNKWGYSTKIIAAAYVLFFVYSVSMDFISTYLEETSNDVLIEQASKIANLSGGTASQSKIRAYIKEKNNNAKMVKVFDELDNLNSPIALLSQIAQAMPSNRKDESFEVRRLVINNEKVDLQGIAKDKKVIERLQKALKSLSQDGKIKTTSPSIKKESGYSLFAFNFKVKRKD